jgi:hypothetical protein
MKNILNFELFTESLEEEQPNDSKCKWCGGYFKASYKDQHCCSDEHLGLFMNREVEEDY